MNERISPHPVPLPLGEGTPSQRARPDSLSHGERAGVRGDALGSTLRLVLSCRRCAATALRPAASRKQPLMRASEACRGRSRPRGSPHARKAPCAALAKCSWDRSSRLSRPACRNCSPIFSWPHRRLFRSPQRNRYPARKGLGRICRARPRRSRGHATRSPAITAASISHADALASLPRAKFIVSPVCCRTVDDKSFGVIAKPSRRSDGRIFRPAPAETSERRRAWNAMALMQRLLPASACSLRCRQTMSLKSPAVRQASNPSYSPAGRIWLAGVAQGVEAA
jgi:hypothetical protein